MAALVEEDWDGGWACSNVSPTTAKQLSEALAALPADAPRVERHDGYDFMSFRRTHLRRSGGPVVMRLEEPREWRAALGFYLEAHEVKPRDEVTAEIQHLHAVQTEFKMVPHHVVTPLGVAWEETPGDTSAREYAAKLVPRVRMGGDVRIRRGTANRNDPQRDPSIFERSSVSLRRGARP